MNELLTQAEVLNSKIKLLILEHEQEIKELCERHQREMDKAQAVLDSLDAPKVKKIKVKQL